LLAGNKIRLVGLKAGTTSVTVWTKSGGEQTYPVVVGPDAAPLRSELAADPALKFTSAVSTTRGVSLEGHTSSLDAHAKAVSLAKTQNGKDVSDNLEVADHRMVAIEVRFAAVSTSTMKALGINFQKLGSGMQFAASVPGSISSANLGSGLTAGGGL